GMGTGRQPVFDPGHELTTPAPAPQRVGRCSPSYWRSSSSWASPPRQRGPGRGDRPVIGGPRPPRDDRTPAYALQFRVDHELWLAVPGETRTDDARLATRRNVGSDSTPFPASMSAERTGSRWWHDSGRFSMTPPRPRSIMRHI